MAHIFKHKENNRLYTIEYLKKDIRFLNGGAFEGIYATSYKGKSKSIITHTRQQLRDREIERFDPERFVANNFEIVGEIW